MWHTLFNYIFTKITYFDKNKRKKNTGEENTIVKNKWDYNDFCVKRFRAH